MARQRGDTTIVSVDPAKKVSAEKFSSRGNKYAASDGTSRANKNYSFFYFCCPPELWFQAVGVSRCTDAEFGINVSSL